MRKTLERLLLVAGVVCCCVALNADVVRLHNGDRISGTVNGLDAGGLHVKSSFAGELIIKTGAVKLVCTDQPLHIRTGNTEIETRSIQFSDGVLQAETADGGIVTAPVDAIAFLVSNQDFLKQQRLRHSTMLEMWSGSASLGFSTARGNAGATNLDVGMKAARVTAKDKLDVYFNSLFARNTSSENGGTSANSIRSGFSYSVNITPRLFTFGFTNFQTDALQELDLRNVIGGGLGLRLARSSHVALDVFSGGSLNQEFYSGKPGRRSGEALLGQELTWGLTSRTTMSERLTMFPNLSDTGEYRIALDSSATVKLNGWLGWQLTLSDTYVSNPPLGATNNDLLLSTGLRFSLGEKHSFDPRLRLADIFQ